MNRVVNGNSCSTDRLEKILKTSNEAPTFLVYVVRSGYDPLSLLYIGMTEKTLEKRFSEHNRHKTFINCGVLEKATLMDNLSKNNASFFEALLIIGNKFQKNLLNVRNEYQNIINNLDVTKDIPHQVHKFKTWLLY